MSFVDTHWRHAVKPWQATTVLLQQTRAVTSNRKQGMKTSRRHVSPTAAHATKITQPHSPLNFDPRASTVKPCDKDQTHFCTTTPYTYYYTITDCDVQLESAANHTVPTPIIAPITEVQAAVPLTIHVQFAILSSGFPSGAHAIDAAHPGVSGPDTTNGAVEFAMSAQ